MRDLEGGGTPSWWAEVLDGVAAAVFIEDFRGNVLFVNSRAADMFGYSRDEFYRHGVSLILPESERSRLDELRSMLREKGSLVFEAVNVSRSGERIPVEVHARYLRMDEDAAIITVVDLRPQKKYSRLMSAVGEYMSEALIIVDVEGRVVYWNAEAERLFGYARDEMMGRVFYEYIAEEPEKFKKCVELYRKGEFDESRVPRRVVETFKTRDGGRFKGEILHSFASMGSERYGIVLVKDVTERVRKEEEQRQTMELYRTVLDQMLGGVLIVRDERIIYANPGLLGMTGYSSDEILGRRVFEYIHPEDRDYVQEAYSERMRGDNAPGEYVARVIKKNGEPIWVLLKPVRVSIDGEYADLISMVDITSAKRMEKSLFHISEVLRDIPVAECEEDIYTKIWNGIGEEMDFGAMYFLEIGEDGVRVLGEYGSARVDVERCASLLHGYDNLVIEDVSECGGSRGYSAYLTVPPCRSRHAMLVLKKGVMSEDERKLMDILAVHLFLWIDRLQTMELLKKSRNLQELLVHILTHDLKTHLAVISGYADLLGERYDREYVDEIKSAVAGAVNIIEKTNVFSKLDMGRISLARERVKLFPLIAGAISTVKQKIPEAKMHIDGGNEEIYCYPLLLQEVLYNLINNAFVHGARTVWLSTEDIGDRVRISVRDDGPGIPDDVKDRIFDPFFKYRSSGSGLGLAIVERIVELHEGKIWVQDSDGHGSVFVIEIPKGP